MSKIKDICKELAEDKQNKKANKQMCIKGILSYFYKLISNNI